MVYAHYPNRRGLIDQLDPPLQTAHFFPQEVNLKSDFLAYGAQSSLRISRSTPISSIGSCFAREIRAWLLDHDYHFLQTASGVGAGAGSARYDRVYSTFGIRQEVERAFGLFKPLIDYWEIQEEDEVHLLDPHRYTIAWEDHAERARESAEHQDAVRRAFTEGEVIIITVGQGEIWYDRRDGSVFPVLPPVEVYDPEIHHFRNSTYQENLDNLRRCRELIHKHNPRAHLIITTSPVPLKLTFTGENSVVANCAMKSMLRAAVDEFVRESDERVSYFPAYEVVTQLIRDPFTEDARHVTRETVDVIMKLFESIYIEPEDSTTTLESAQPESVEEWWTLAERLRREQAWGPLSVYLESVKDHRRYSDDEVLIFLDLYGEACLRMGRDEDANGLLLRARKIWLESREGLYLFPHGVRLNYLIALNHLEDHELTYTLCLELAQERARLDRSGEGSQVSLDMVLVWLNSVENTDAMTALELSTRLFGEAAQLLNDPPLSEWFTSLLKRLDQE